MANEWEFRFGDSFTNCPKGIISGEDKACYNAINDSYFRFVNLIGLLLDERKKHLN